jgi:hypothetical protein
MAELMHSIEECRMTAALSEELRQEVAYERMRKRLALAQCRGL